MATSIPDNQDAETATHAAPPNELNRLEVLRGLRISIWEGSFATLWIALTSGVFLTGYALWLGADNKTLGLITAIPTFAALIQIVSAFFGERLQARKPFTAWFSLAGRLLWLPILLLPLLLPHSLALAAFLVLYAASSTLLNIPSPAYMSWMSDLVPPNHRGRYFGRRNMIAGVVALVIGLPAAWFLDFATRRHHWEAWGFGTLFAVAIAGAILAFTMLLRQPEPPMPPSTNRDKSAGFKGILAYYKAPFADTNFMRLMKFNIVFGFGQNIAAPFFIPYALKVLHLDYTWIQIFATLSSIANLLSLPLWGYLSDRFGNKPLLAISVVGTFTLPLYWVAATAHNIPLALVLIAINNFTAGGFWAGFGLLQFNLLIRLSPSQKTPVYVAMMSAVTGLTSGIAPLVGGQIMDSLVGVQAHLSGFILGNYQIVFLLASLLRLSGLIFLRPLQDADAISTRAVLVELTRSSPKAWRSIRRLQRPADEEARLLATETLGATRARVATGELEQGLFDPSHAVRAASARALGASADPAALASLLNALNDPATGIIGELAHALAQIGDRIAAPELAAWLSEPSLSHSDRLAVYSALGTLGGDTAAQILLEAFAHPADEETLATLAVAAGESGNALFIAPLVQLLQQNLPLSVQSAIIESLGTLNAIEALPLLHERLHTLDADSLLLPTLADSLAKLNDTHALIPLLSRLDALPSPVARKQVGAAVGMLTGQGEAVYRLLSLEETARETAIARLINEMQRRLRGTPAATSLAEISDAYLAGNYSGIAGELPALLNILPPLETDTPASVLSRSLLLHTARADTPTRETILLTFLALKTLIAPD